MPFWVQFDPHVRFPIKDKSSIPDTAATQTHPNTDTSESGFGNANHNTDNTSIQTYNQNQKDDDHKNSKVAFPPHFNTATGDDCGLSSLTQTSKAARDVYELSDSGNILFIMTN